MCNMHIQLLEIGMKRYGLVSQGNANRKSHTIGNFGLPFLTIVSESVSWDPRNLQERPGIGTSGRGEGWCNGMEALEEDGHVSLSCTDKMHLHLIFGNPALPVQFSHNGKDFFLFQKQLAAERDNWIILAL